MKRYRINNIIGYKTTALTVQEEGGLVYRAALAGKRGEAALFLEDRLILQVEPVGGFMAWRLFQDGLLRAVIFFGPPNLFSFVSAPESSIRHIRGKMFRVQGAITGWNIQLYGPQGMRMGRFQRLPDGYLIESEDAADPFLALGMALFILAAIKEAAVDERFPRQVTSSHVHIQPSPSPKPSRPRPAPRRRRWIDDPIVDRNRRPGGAPKPDDRWLDEPSRDPNKWKDDPLNKPERRKRLEDVLHEREIRRLRRSPGPAEPEPGESSVN